jgi:predicted phosphodiesterase
MVIKIQVVSDIHAEFWEQKTKMNFFKPSAPILALLGDICCCGSDDDFDLFKRVITELLPKYEKIIFITGNHEYYYNDANTPTIANTIQGINAKIQTFFKQTSPKLVFLYNSILRIKYGNTRYIIAGTTLWSNIPKSERQRIQESMNDYNYIYVNTGRKVRKLNANDVHKLHTEARTFIARAATEAKKERAKLIVLTHHKPYLSDDYDTTTLYPAYESDVTDLFTPNMLFWCYGHTHIADDRHINGVHLYSNPKGYPRQKTKFAKDQYIRGA